jgi:hypothetical protein
MMLLTATTYGNKPSDSTFSLGLQWVLGILTDPMHQERQIEVAQSSLGK